MRYLSVTQFDFVSRLATLAAQFCLAASFVVPHAAGAEPPSATRLEVTVHTRDQLVEALQDCAPGTKIMLASGTYRGGLSIRDLHGRAGQPIELTALEPDNPPVFEGGTSGLHLISPRYVQLSHLAIRGSTGNGLNIDDGGNYPQNAAREIVLRDLQISEIGPTGNRDGIKLSGVDDFRVEGCDISRWGSSGSGIDMVGCHRGEIRECQFSYRDGIPANGVQTKGGSSEIVIRRCRFDHAGGRAVNIGGSTGEPYFRPPAAGYEAREITVEDCILIGSDAPFCFVGVDGATVQYNTVYRPSRWVLRILQESRGEEFIPCRNGVFRHNLVYFRAADLRGVVNIGEGTLPESFTFSHNHWYCSDRPERSSQLGLPAPETGGSYGEDPKFLNTELGDLRLWTDSPVRNAGVRPAISAP